MIRSTTTWRGAGTEGFELGCDRLGRDYVSRLIYGARVSVGVGVIVATLAALIRITIGVAAGYFGGWIERFASFGLNVRLATPVTLVALTVAVLVGTSLATLVMVLSLFLWDRFAVVGRALARGLRGADYIKAARLMGCSDLQIILQDVLPNIAPGLVVVFTLEFANTILLELTLSFLGFGVPPPTASWGLMLAEGREMIFARPYVVALPGAAIFALVLCINLIGDGLRRREPNRAAHAGG
jgi:peptide/nickel transport system permease protein